MAASIPLRGNSVDAAQLRSAMAAHWKFVFAAGVTSGVDGALRVAAMLRGDDEAQAIQLQLQYAPEPPFNAGTPKTAPAHVAARCVFAGITEQHEHTARRTATGLGITH